MNRELQADDKQRIVRLIHEAFRGVTLGGGVGLHEGQGLDQYANEETLAELRERDEKDDWTRITADTLNECYSSLSFFDAEGMRFHIPAYLIADLQETFMGDVVFHLAYSGDSALDRFEQLNAEQRHAVREFLLYHLSQMSPPNDFAKDMIEQTLAEYWTPIEFS